MYIKKKRYSVFETCFGRGFNVGSELYIMDPKTKKGISLVKYNTEWVTSRRAFPEENLPELISKIGGGHKFNEIFSVLAERQDSTGHFPYYTGKDIINLDIESERRWRRIRKKRGYY